MEAKEKIKSDLKPSEIMRRLKAEYDIDLSKQYVAFILNGQRTGYKYRKSIAKILGKTERQVFGPRKAKRPRSQKQDRRAAA